MRAGEGRGCGGGESRRGYEWNGRRREVGLESWIGGRMRGIIEFSFAGSWFNVVVRRRCEGSQFGSISGKWRLGITPACELEINVFVVNTEGPTQSPGQALTLTSEGDPKFIGGTLSEI